MFVLCDLDSDAVFQYTTGTSDIATFTYPEVVEFPGAAAPASPAVGETDTLEFLTTDGGASYFGRLVGDAHS
jgi:hypothetical protein